MKDICHKCSYWAGFGKAYKCYTDSCPAKQRDEKEIKKKKELRREKKASIVTKIARRFSGISASCHNEHRNNIDSCHRSSVSSGCHRISHAGHC